MGEKLTGEQLSLFTIHSVQVSKPKDDPYWDEITTNFTSEAQSDTVDRDSCCREIAESTGNTPLRLGVVSPNLVSNYEVENATQPKTVNSLVGAQVTTDTKKFAPQHDTPTHWVEKYWVERGGNKYWYYRYCWMTGRKKSRRYIGSVESAIAQNRKSEIEMAIADGETPSGIQNLIRSWRE